MSQVIILGFGVEGQAATRYFLSHTNKKLTVLDGGVHRHRSSSEFGNERNIAWYTDKDVDIIGRHDGTTLLRSPGIAPSHPIVKAALTQGMPVTTPTGYWLEHHAPKGTVTVTGTKGKSSTVSMLSFILNQLGFDSIGVGNIGAPPLDEVLPTAPYPVVELSSYMMHDLPIGPYTHLVTSLYREHTTWHGTEAAYRAAKLRPFRFSPPAPGFAPKEVIETEHLPSSVTAFEKSVAFDGTSILLGGEKLDVSSLHPQFASPTDRWALRAACAIALTLTDPLTLSDCLTHTLGDYRGLPHRQEIIPSTDERIWVDDALATVPEAVIQALSRWPSAPVTLLLGGADRGQDFNALAEFLAARNHIHTLAFGPIAARAATALHDTGCSHTSLSTYNEALEHAALHTPKGGVILFSPGAASEPPFRAYTERAAMFKATAEGA
ncbi:MAG: UDP-N-acetylmuramoyl-L-alanine--D-glutamate ligase [Pseudomonadota bacterium]